MVVDLGCKRGRHPFIGVDGKQSTGSQPEGEITLAGEVIKGTYRNDVGVLPSDFPKVASRLAASTTMTRSMPSPPPPNSPQGCVPSFLATTSTVNRGSGIANPFHHAGKSSQREIAGISRQCDRRAGPQRPARSTDAIPGRHGRAIEPIQRSGQPSHGPGPIPYRGQGLRKDPGALARPFPVHLQQ